jgi:hypothetical protein
MYPYFDVDGLSVERLLEEWRWLCPGKLRLVAVDAFADLFFEGSDCAVNRLDTTIGRFDRIAGSVEEFVRLTERSENRKKWFCEDVAIALAEQRFDPAKGKCIAYKTPIAFAGSNGDVSKVYIADLYEYVSFLGDLNFQMKDVPDGGKVRLVVGKKPSLDA